MVKNTINKTKQILKKGLEKVVSWIADDKNEVTRVSIGGGIALAGFIYCCLIQTQADTTATIFLTLKTFVSAFAMISGLLLITRNFEPLNYFFVRLAVELTWFVLAALGFYTAVMFGTEFKTLSFAKEIWFLVASSVAISWLIHFIIFFVKLVKLAIEKGIAKMVKKTNEGAKSVDEFVKNLISIAGSLALLYSMVKPLIDKMLGI